MARIACALSAVLLVVSGCGGGQGPVASAPKTEDPAAPDVRSPDNPKAASSALADPAPPGGSETPPSSDAGEPEVEAAYPPPAITPPFARSAHEGDGIWVPLAASGDRASEGKPVFFKTLIHPHPESRFISLTVVAIDLTRVHLHFMPGKEDVGTQKTSFTPGLVPLEQKDKLLAVFNGGFQPRHGRWGMQLAEASIVPPRDIGCTVALHSNGTVSIRSWPHVADRTNEMRAFRQTPPCLVEQGKLHPDLLAGRDKVWGGKTPGVVTRRRSAIGIDRTGRTLFYAVSIEAPPKLLAEGLRASGAYDAAELDINWNWTRFLLFGKNEQDELRVSSSLVEGTYAKSGYVERPSERDFFYILRK